MKHYIKPMCLVLACMSIGFAGCSRGPQTFSVAGMVTMEGKPIEQGTVMFVPVAGAANETATGQVVNGAYELECIPGEKVVKVMGLSAGMTPIPLRYLEGAELSANIQEDATGVDFDLSQKPSRRRR